MISRRTGPVLACPGLSAGVKLLRACYPVRISNDALPPAFEEARMGKGRAARAATLAALLFMIKKVA